MYATVLVALDGSKNAEKVLPYLEPLLKGPKSRAILVQVLPEGERAPAAAAEAYLASVAARLAKHGVSASGELVTGDPATALLRTAERRKADLLACASHGQGGLSRWMFGSVAQKLLRGCSRPIFVARALEPVRPKIARILVPLDGSVASEATVPHALAMARAWEASLTLLHVVSEKGVEAADSKLRAWGERERRRMEARFAQIAAAEKDVRVDGLVDEGDAAERIVIHAERKPGTLVAMAGHGRTALHRWVFGSVSEKVLQAVRTPLLIIR